MADQESLSEQIMAFYAGKADKKTGKYYEHDENGYLVRKDKSGSVVSTIVPKRYRLATPEELKEDDMAYRERLQEAIETYQSARIALFDEQKKMNKGSEELDEKNDGYTNDQKLLELNQAVLEADKALCNARFHTSYVDYIIYDDVSVPTEKKITMHQLQFGTAPDINVYYNLSILETQAMPMQHLFREDTTQLISVARAKANARSFAKNKKAITKVLSALDKSAVKEPVATAAVTDAAVTDAAVTDAAVAKEPVDTLASSVADVAASISKSISNTATKAASAITEAISPATESVPSTSSVKRKVFVRRPAAVPAAAPANVPAAVSPSVPPSVSSSAPLNQM